MTHHLTHREYMISLKGKTTTNKAIDVSKSIEKWEVYKILHSGESEIEKLIKSN